MEYSYGFAVVAILVLITGFGIGTASVPITQFCFLLSTVMAGVSIVFDIRSRVQNVTKNRF